jgi:hypothetical protein
MSQTSSRSRHRDWPTPVLVATSEVLRTITPTTFALLVLADSSAVTTQTEIADAINRDQSTVSDGFQSLTIETADADIPLVEKSGYHYEITGMGEQVREFATDTLRQLGINPDMIDWRSESDKDKIGSHLSPLYGSKSVEPFFLLDSLATRSEIEGNRDDSQSVDSKSVTEDVKKRLQKIGETTSKRQLWQLLNRLVEEGAITSADGRLALTKKGRRHADLINQVAEAVNKRSEANQNTISDSPTVDEIAVQMRRGRLATSYSLENDDPELIDESHFYQKVKRIDALDTPNDDWHSYRWLTIENTGTAPTNSIVHKESGDTKITFEDMDLAVFLGGPDGEKLEVENLTDYQPAIEQKMKIYFPRPLPPGESLTIYYRISWPNELAHYPEGELDQTISLTRYPKGVDELQFGVVDKVEHIGIDCQKFLGEEGQRWKCLSIAPEHIEADDCSDLELIHGEGYGGYIYTIPSPVYPAYRIAYTLVEGTEEV